MELAKVGAVDILRVFGSRNYVQDEINKKLAAGWVLLNIQTIASRHSVHGIDETITVFVLGKTRQLIEQEAHEKHEKEESERLAKLPPSEHIVESFP